MAVRSMHPSIRLFGRPARCGSLVLACSGCALTTAKIDVPYQPIATAATVPGAEQISVAVTTTDGRTTYRDRVSSKKNGYGMEMAAIIAAIIATNDVVATVHDAFQRELTERGFVVGTGGRIVQVELVRFYNDFKTGIFSGDAVANVAFNVSVISPDTHLVFSKYYEGTGTEPNIQIMGADNARSALIKAFTASVNGAVSDPLFIGAVMGSTAQISQTSMPAAQPASTADPAS